MRADAKVDAVARSVMINRVNLPEGRYFQIVAVGLSLGVALYPRDGIDGETLRRNADTALYMAKRAGRQTYHCFEPRMNDELARFIQIRDALRDALERQEFVLHYRGKGGLRLRPR